MCGHALALDVDLVGRVHCGEHVLYLIATLFFHLGTAIQF